MNKLRYPIGALLDEPVRLAVLDRLIELTASDPTRRFSLQLVTA